MASEAPPPPTNPPPAETGLIRAHGLAALLMVGYSVLLGLVVAAKFLWPDWLGSEAWLTWGRLRYAHTQGIFFGWLGNAFLLFLYYAVPRLAERPITSRTLGWVLFVVWNFLLVLPGWILLHLGYSQPLEWGEFPIVIDVVVVVALLMTAGQFVLPFLRVRLADLYVAGWYILGGITFTLLAYPIGNFVPELIPGARGATYSGLWIHDAIGLYVTPLALAMAYVVIPVTTGRPIYSHFLSMVGFWLLFLVYPLNGTHHYLFSSIPMEAQKGAIVASVYLGVDVILVVANLLLSLRGSSGVVARDAALRFTWLGIVCYLIVSMQGSLQALQPVNRFIHYSDWVIGHSHLAMIGFASFTAIGGVLFVWQRTPGLRYNAWAAEWSFWLLSVGLAAMVADLTIAGLVQGELWQSEAPWMDSVRASGVFWLTRTLSGLVILGGFVFLGVSMTTGPVGQVAALPTPTLERKDSAVDQGADLESVPGLGWLRNAYVVTAVAGLGAFLFSFVVLAVWPNRTLEKQIAEARPTDLRPLTAREAHGREVYAREGCMNCHSQMVRFTEEDVRRFGQPGQAWEGERDYPQLWGTRRIGPDLSRESRRKSRDWQLVHLWNPRFVVHDSIMPPYPWLFDGSPTRPNEDAHDLVAYLDSLGREAQLAGFGQPVQPPPMDAEEELRRGMFCDCAIPRSAGPAPWFQVGIEPGERTRSERVGARAFARNCAGCHGAQGRGDGHAAEALLIAPRNLTNARFSDRALSHTLWFGVPGSSMPPFNDLSAADLRGLVAYVQSLESNPSPTPEEALAGKDLEEARTLFRVNCTACHGPEGGSQGMYASTLAPAATDFRLIRPSPAYAEAVLANGLPMTAMPPWKDKLTEDQRRLLIRYVRSLYLPRPFPE
jgi:cbb3-type cytochrome oxidase subunit 1/cbb3-type cytochrome oxidase cytochrome c subunit/mono/diheme cytochrome c family protein